MKRRKFTNEEKVKILEEASKNGVTTTLEHYVIYPATYYAWKKKYASMGEEGFAHGMTPGQLKRIRELEKENRRVDGKTVKLDTQIPDSWLFCYKSS